jgi:glycosyltransferase involved in cell wall biosynthesis
MIKMKLNFISNVNLKEISGGWSGLNSKIFEGLSKIFDLNYIGPIEVPINKRELFISRVQRFFKFKGNYFYFSESRLRKISTELSKKVNNDDAIFYFGATSWVKAKTKVKYYIITDISFFGYHKYYNKHKFKASEIMRISQQEKTFIENAEHIFFTSKWAIEETKKYYNIDGSNMVNVGLGGNVEGFLSKQKSEIISFLYISQSFSGKGGNELFDAFEDFYLLDSSSKLTIIGGTPSKKVLNHPGVEYIGFINKSIPAQNNKYIKILSESSLLILPTKADVVPVALIECGYFGTPTIAPARFAIPEMVIPEETGYLLKKNFAPSDIYDYMMKFKKLSLLERNNFRIKTFKYFQEKNNWENIITEISLKINESNC